MPLQYLSSSYLLRLGLLIAAYFISAKIGLTFSAVHGSVSLLWLPTGVALASLVLMGWRYWPGVLLGAFLANALTNGPISFAVIAGIGNTLEAVIGAYLLRRFADFHPKLDRVQDVFALVCFAAGFSTIVSASFGALGVCISGMAPWSEFGSTWAVWWLGDALGALIVAPFLLAWGTRLPIRLTTHRAIEIGLWLLALTLASWLSFNVRMSQALTDFSLAYLSFPFLMWAALRFGMRGGTTATLILLTIAAWGTLNRLGLFASPSVNAPLLFLWVFMGVAAVTTMFLAAAVTERKNTEDALRHSEAQFRLLNAELEQRVQQRTSQLQAAVQARDEFLSIAAHELKTPITSLHGFSQLILRNLKNDKIPPMANLKHSIEVIDQQAIKLTRLIARLLDTSRLEFGRLNLERQPTDVSAMVARIVSMLQATTNRHDIMLYADPSLIASVDPLRFEQVIVNLLDNAIKYSPNGGVITLDLTQSTPENLRVACTDNGIGIPAEHRPHIFDRFYRAHTKQPMTGMGLGLYISKEIIELHGGQLSAEFPDNGGTRFVVTLPCNS